MIDSDDVYMLVSKSVSNGLDYNYENFLKLKATLNPQGTFSNAMYAALGARWFHIEADKFIRESGGYGGRDAYIDAISTSLSEDFYGDWTMDL